MMNNKTTFITSGVFLACVVGLLWFCSFLAAGSGPDGGIASGICFTFGYFMLFAVSIVLTIIHLIYWRTITKMLARCLGFLPIGLTVGVPLCLHFVPLPPYVATPNNKLVIELRSSIILRNAEAQIINREIQFSEPLTIPEYNGTHYIYRISKPFYTESDTQLVVVWDNGRASFVLDSYQIQEGKHYSDWLSPEYIESDFKKTDCLNLRLGIEKNDI